MSRIATAACSSTMPFSRLSITTWLRMLSSVPISGTATMPSHSRMTGVEISISSCRCRATTSSLSLSSTTTAATRSEPISSVTASSSAGTVAAPG